MLRLGLSSCYFAEQTLDAWKAAKAAGFTDVEISVGGTVPQFIERGRKVSDLVHEAGLNVWSIHIPFSREYDFTCPDPANWSAIEERYKVCIAAGAAWGAKVITTHASTEPIDQNYRTERMARGKALYRSLGEFAASLGMRITVEVLPRLCMGNCSKECMEFTDGEVSFINFDVNHLLKESHADFIANAGERIITTHLSDYDYTDEKHWVPGDGKIDWREFYTLMEAKHYEGPYLFELSETVSGKLVTPAELAERFKKLIGYTEA